MENKYFTGKPCKNGHIDFRYKSNNLCISCCKNRLKKYKKTEKYKIKEVKHNTSERRKKYLSEWRRKNKYKCCEYSQKWRTVNHKKVLEYSRKYKVKNKDKLKIYEEKRWMKNKKELKLKRKNHQKNNKEMWATYSRNEGARKKNSRFTHTKNEIFNLIKKQKSKCIYCKIDINKKYHVDHKLALINGGHNGIKNIQILCPKCNLRKNKMLHSDFIKKLKRLNEI